MNKIILHDADVEFILRWRDEHKDLVRRGMTPLEEIKMIFPDVGMTLTVIRTNRAVSFSITAKGKSLGKLRYNVLAPGKWVLAENKTKLSEENIQSVLTVYASTMALLVFGRTTIKQDEQEVVREILPKPTKSRHKAAGRPENKSKGYVYILADPSAPAQERTQSGKRRKPQGQFNVRGHYRHYKNGKTVWIAEYVKGHGKAKDKTYKLGLKEGVK